MSLKNQFKQLYFEDFHLIHFLISIFSLYFLTSIAIFLSENDWTKIFTKYFTKYEKNRKMQ